ncbi:MAG: hypothetical protein OER90_11475, partial [Gemmatimonadota bacterium]|nr:hypothetical protein [Gemmatimonadota bacterium]
MHGSLHSAALLMLTRVRNTSMGQAHPSSIWNLARLSLERVVAKWSGHRYPGGLNHVLRDRISR